MFAGTACSAPEPSPPLGEAERVYAALLTDRHAGLGSVFVLVQRETVAGPPMLPGGEGNERIDVAFVRDSLPRLKDQTIRHFEATNAREERIDGLATLTIPHALKSAHAITRMQEYETFSGDAPSETNPTGIVRLSSVGFDRTVTQALVYAEYFCGGTCGYGEYVLLTKRNGEWRVSKSRTLFVS